MQTIVTSADHHVHHQALTRIGLLPSTLKAIEKLTLQTERFYADLCFWRDGSWVELPPHLKEEIDQGRWDESLEELTIIAHLISVEVAQ